MTGNLTLDGILNVEDLGGFGVGLSRIFDYGGVLTDNGLDVGTTPAGVPASALSIQTTIDNEVDLVSAAGATLAFWDGATVRTMASSTAGTVSGTPPTATGRTPTAR